MLNIFGNSKNQRANTSSTEESGLDSQIKYEKPRILLLDMDEDTAQLLSSAGFRIETGSCGAPYKVHNPHHYLTTPICLNHDTPNNIHEMDMVILDLTQPEIADKSSEHPLITETGIRHVVDIQNRDVIDPRPTYFWIIQPFLDTIIDNGGFFIIFYRQEYEYELIIRRPSTYSDSYLEDKINVSTWGFLKRTQYLHDTYAKGDVINFDTQKSLGRLLDKYSEGATYEGTISSRSDNWIELAHNKHGQCVAGIFLPDSEESGFVLVLPQFETKAELILELVQDFLPNIVPHLYPNSDKLSWINEQPYQLEQVITLQNEIDAIRSEADEKIEQIENQIQITETEHKYQRDLLVGTGDELVKAVKRCLEILGFSSVINVDELYETENRTPDEDLRIEDKSPMLLVEVKGISAIPRDEDALAVHKYLAPRMRELDRTDIEGLSIINQEKHIPPLQRSSNPFRNLILDNAQSHNIGLMTTWTLWRLLRGFTKYDWKHEYIRDLFYQDEVIEPIPLHYQPLGKIVKLFEDQQSIGILTELSLQVGDIIAFDFAVDFYEVKIDSLQVHNEIRESVAVDEETGIKFQFPDEKIHEGMVVYKVDDSYGI